MRRSFGRRARIVAFASALVCSGCPSQDLAALNPCTVSAASIRVDQGGISQVDLLFVIDNSNSMASEQLKIAEELPRLVSVLTNGDRYFGRQDQVPPGLADKDRFFTKASSLHIGVVSSSMHVMDELPKGVNPSLRANVGLVSCTVGDDDGKLRSSTEVAANGISDSKGELVPASPECGELGDQPRYQDFEAGKGPSAEDVASAFACVSRLGIEGCPFEQQLEAMWKAVAPSDGDDPELHTFLNNAHGLGDPIGFNQGFVREDAILAVIQVSDEEDCSIQEAGKQLFSYDPDAIARFGPPSEVNLRCGKYGDAEDLLWPAERYVRGLRSLKPNNEDRIIYAAIVGIPLDAIGRPLDEVLAREDMQFAPDPLNATYPRASCTSASAGGSSVDQAYPPRRFLEVAKGFGTNAVVYSICADDYAPALNTLIDRIAEKLTGNCLPRQLTPDEKGNVHCEVFELLAKGETQCSKARGHLDTKPEPHPVREKSGEVVTRPGCKMAQVPVLDQAPSPNKTGWFYDDFGDGLTECQEGNRQRVSFTFGTLPPGASAVIECVQPVARIDPLAKGVDAVNSRCHEDGDECAGRSNANDGGHALICVENTCQISCENNPDCPAAWVCDQKNGTSKGPKYCQLPTCPPEETSTDTVSNTGS